MITYADIMIKQVVEDWSDARGGSAECQLQLHLEERFGVKDVSVVSAEEKEMVLILKLSTDKWREPREFALLPNGALCW
ncbi:MAG: hypothetical protein ACO1RA_06845 [Planctomycetaceae bacterium]